MTRDPGAGGRSLERFSLRRWAQRKLEAARAQSTPVSPSPGPGTAAATTPPAVPAAAPELPPIESLTFESDFTVFLRPSVDATVRRAALKQLFRDPRFNVMDGLDTYIDDYTRPDPIPDAVVRQLVQSRAIFEPTRTVVAPEGHAVDAPPPASLTEAQAAPASSEALPASSPRAQAQGSPAPPDDGGTGAGKA